MTYEEALTEISTVCYGMDRDLEEAITSALKKQIPKKPIKADGDNLDYNCPVCGKFVGWVDALAWEKEHHCQCGQEIDWSDVT